MVVIETKTEASGSLGEGGGGWKEKRKQIRITRQTKPTRKGIGREENGE